MLQKIAHPQLSLVEAPFERKERLAGGGGRRKLHRKIKGQLPVLGKLKWKTSGKEIG